MKVMGLFAVTLAVCLMSMTMAQPLFFAAPVATATFTTAGGLVLASATGTTLATVPTWALLAGAVGKKIALLKLLAEAENQ